LLALLKTRDHLAQLYIESIIMCWDYQFTGRGVSENSHKKKDLLTRSNMLVSFPERHTLVTPSITETKTIEEGLKDNFLRWHSTRWDSKRSSVSIIRSQAG
jgi:hypothetical protein